ncbi:MAG: hydrogenase maturation protease [Candidatus Binatia bacterium]
MHERRIVIIGVGNVDRGDDAIGLAVVGRLKEKVAEGIIVKEVSGDCTTLLDTWAVADNVSIIDATHSGAAPGTIQRFDARASPLPSEFGSYSTHALGVAEAIALARALGILPAILIVYGVEGASYAIGESMSDAVVTAIDTVVEQLLQDIEQWQQQADEYGHG